MPRIVVSISSDDFGITTFIFPFFPEPFLGSYFIILIDYEKRVTREEKSLKAFLSGLDPPTEAIGDKQMEFLMFQQTGLYLLRARDNISIGC